MLFDRVWCAAFTHFGGNMLLTAELSYLQILLLQALLKSLFPQHSMLKVFKVENATGLSADSRPDL
jgi:hypothetical protein